MAAGLNRSDSVKTLTEAEPGIWGAADRGDVAGVQRWLEEGVDVNARNCLGCVPLMYAAGSGHLEVVNLLLAQPGVCVNIRNNDRLTCFMLAMQVGRDASGWTGSGQEQLKKMMDLPSLSEVDWARNDRVSVARLESGLTLSHSSGQFSWRPPASARPL